MQVFYFYAVPTTLAFVMLSIIVMLILRPPEMPDLPEMTIKAGGHDLEARMPFLDRTATS